MSETRGCVDADELAAFAAHTLSPDDETAIREHAASCEGCAKRLAEAEAASTAAKESAGATSDEPAPAAALTGEPPTTPDPGPAPRAPAPVAPSAVGSRLPIGVGLALLAVIGAGAMTSRPPAPVTSTVALAPPSPSVAPPPAPRSAERVRDPATRARIAAAFEAVHAPTGSANAAMTLLLAAAGEIESAARAEHPPAERECLALIDAEVLALADEAERVKDRSAAEGVVIAGRDLERPVVCRGAKHDHPEGDARPLDLVALTRVRMRRPLTVSPVLPSRSSRATKAGLFAFATVLGAIARDRDAFADDGAGRAFDGVLDAVMKDSKKESLPQGSEDRLAKELLGTAIHAADAGSVDYALDVSIARSFEHEVGMIAVGARIDIVQAILEPKPHLRAAALSAVAPKVATASDEQTRTMLEIALARSSAERGARPVQAVTSAYERLSPNARPAAVPRLEALGDLALDRAAADVTAEKTAVLEIYGAGHPHVALARVHEAEWLLEHDDPKGALAAAREARVALEDSISNDADVELVELRAASPLADSALPGRLGPWTPARHVGAEAYAKYVHLARALAVIVTAAPEAEARAAAKAGRALRGRDEANATTLPVELASTARFSDPTRGFDFERAGERLDNPVFLARARARAASLEKDAAKANEIYERALGLVKILPPIERFQLHFAAAKRTTDRERRANLLSHALDDAPPSERKAVEAAEKAP